MSWTKVFSEVDKHNELIILWIPVAVTLKKSVKLKSALVFFSKFVTRAFNIIFHENFQIYSNWTRYIRAIEISWKLSLEINP